MVQVVFDPEYTRGEAWSARGVAMPKDAGAASINGALELAEQMRGEWVVGVRGVVVSRGANVNSKIPTGEVEVLVIEATVFNRANTPPFEIQDEIETREE